jgi:hypothetical protein
VRCAAKWSHDHKCPDMVQLHLVQELCDLFPADDDPGTKSPPSPTHLQPMVHLSVATAVGAVAPKTLCLTGQLQQHPISILVDSGSSHTFLSTKVAATLSGVQQL